MKLSQVISLVVVLAIVALISADDSGPFYYMYIPSYGNQSADGSFNVRFYGLIYTRDELSNNFIASDFINSDLANQLQDSATTDVERQNLKNNLDPFLHWDLQNNEQITFNIPTAGVNVTMTDHTGLDGQFDEFLSFNDSTLQIGGIARFLAVNPVDARPIQGNATIYAAKGISVISDLDDVLRITTIWKPLDGLKNTFMEPYVPVPGMPKLLQQWQKQLQNPGFHYATTTPVPLAGAYTEWIYGVYPFGALDLRPLNIADPDAILNARADQLTRIGQTYPSRRFIMLGDTSSNTLIKAYPQFARDHPEQLACIFIRNITYTYPDYSNPLIDLEKEFQGVPRQQWFVFNTPDDLYNIDIASLNCHPPGVPANQTTASGGYGGTRSESPMLSQGSWTLVILSLMALLIIL
jgi:phosphatidate phosphatase APP1